VDNSLFDIALLGLAGGILVLVVVSYRFSLDKLAESFSLIGIGLAVALASVSALLNGAQPLLWAALASFVLFGGAAILFVRHSRVPAAIADPPGAVKVSWTAPPSMPNQNNR
jgi:peptidoglycan/LPS O-acetylase OafA/YrhL